MSKTPPQTLIEETAEELVTFLRNGGINERELTSTLDFTDLAISEFRRLKRIHFVLSDPVIKFVKSLPRNVRRIKTETTRSRDVMRGEIEGKIDWGETTKLRNSQSYGDRTLFVCETPYSEYDIPENLVLKQLLNIIYKTITDDIARIDYAWRTERWDDSLINDLTRVVERNVHINRIRNADTIDLRQRDLDAARQSRRDLYREAYELYSRYDRLMANDFSNEAVRQLLTETLVDPDNDPTLFELFCVFKLIRVLRTEYDQLQIQPVQNGGEAIARMESSSREISVYTDNTGTLTLREMIDDVTPPLPPYLQRARQVIDAHQRAANEAFGTDPGRELYQGRPDIIVEIYDITNGTKQLDRLLLGEIKYSDQTQTASRGLKQLLEYMTYAREAADSTTYFVETDVNLRGLLFVDKIEATQPSREDLTIVTTDDLQGEPTLSSLCRSPN